MHLCCTLSPNPLGSHALPDNLWCRFVKGDTESFQVASSDPRLFRGSLWLSTLPMSMRLRMDHSDAAKTRNNVH